MYRFAAFIGLGMLISTAALAKAPAELIRSALEGDHRDPANVERDTYRNPEQTLEFFGWQPEMAVIEIWPATGWYTEVLAPITRAQGVYFAAGFAMTADRTPQWRKTMHKEYMEKLGKRPDVYDHVVITELSVPERTTIAPPGSADMVLTFRNVHNWMKGDYAGEMFEVFYRALKPGGILGVVEHRAPAGTGLATMKESGYVTEAHAIALAEGAGFVFEEKSGINANPADEANHPAGVWTLPPSLRYCRRMDSASAREECEHKYRGIGESDRMTLRFRKPGG
ncbi:MAG: methyltransferase [Gammaproteobacteria bacterium]|nr:methyltransferase [Gammaproteobacteria bacterium]